MSVAESPRRRPGRRGRPLWPPALLVALVLVSSAPPGAASGASVGSTAYFDLGRSVPAAARYLRVSLPLNADVAHGPGRAGAWGPGAWGDVWDYNTSPESKGYKSSFSVEIYDVGDWALDPAAEAYAEALPAAITTRGGKVLIRPSKLRRGGTVSTAAGRLNMVAFDYTWKHGDDGKALRTTAQAWRMGDWLLVATAANVETNEFSSLLFDGISFGARPAKGTIERSVHAWGPSNRSFRVVHGMPPWALRPSDLVDERMNRLFPGGCYASEAWGRPDVQIHVAARAALGDPDQDLEAVLSLLSEWTRPAPGKPLVKIAGSFECRIQHAFGSSRSRTGLTTVGLVHAGAVVLIVALERSTLFPERSVEADRQLVWDCLRPAHIREKTVDY